MGVLLSESYYEMVAGKISSYLPFLLVKQKSDKISIGGKSFSYEDATKFVARNGEYIPLICLPDCKLAEASGSNEDDVTCNGERVVDLYPFLNIGLTEVLLALEHNRPFFCQNLLSALTSENLFQSAEDAIRHILNRNTFYDALEWSIRTSYMRYDFSSIKKIVCLLNIARKTNPKFYFEQLFDLMKIAYSCCLLWVDKSMESLTATCVPNTGILSQKGITKPLSRYDVSPDALKTGALTYETKGGVKRTVTDGRGLSIYFFLSFLHHTYLSYADFSATGKDGGICKSGEVLKTINENLASCIGNDSIGKWLLTGRRPSPKADEESGRISLLADTTVFDSKKTVLDDKGNKSTRAMMDSLAMFTRATGFSRDDGDSLCYNYCFYESFAEMCGTCFWPMLVHDELEMLSDATKEKIALIIEEKSNSSNENQKENDSKTTGETEETLRRELVEKSKENDSLKDEQAKMRQKIEDLERQLENKRRVIGEKCEEIEKLKAISDSIYDEEDLPDMVSQDENTSIEEQVRYLNNFKITIAGGHFDTERRLSEMGLSNLVYITNEGLASGNEWDTDFICICATFVSHKIVRSVESQFPNKRGETMYFNGTNAEKLVRSLYAFVKKWVGES